MRPNFLIGDIFESAARAVPDKAAVALGAHTLSFAELEASSNQLARQLSSSGIAVGARVTTWCSTSIDSVPLFAALSKLGAIYIPVNGLLRAHEAATVIETSKPDLVITDRSHTGLLDSPPSEKSLEGLLEESALKDPSAGPIERALEGGDPHVVFYTSGSTGKAKGAVLSQETNYLRTHPGALLEPRGAMVCPYPLFHMGAWTIALQQWQARDTVVLLESASADQILEVAERHRATRLNCIPAVWRRILSELERGGGSNALDSVRFADTGTSVTPLELLEAIEEALPKAHIRVFYGSTEAGIVTSLDHVDMRRKPGSCGVPAPGVSVRTDDAGELWARSTTMFDGYLDDPGATADSLVDGWYRTGDLGEFDEEGFLTIVGRAGELIRTGGESVVPSEVESVLEELETVAAVVVVGVPDTTWGEVVCAVVVPTDPGAAPTLEDLRLRCEGRLAPYKHPRRLEISSSIPRTGATGQVQRRLLVERLTES